LAAKVGLRLSSLTLSWALSVHGSLVLAASAATGLPPYDVEAEIIASEASGRLLESNGEEDLGSKGQSGFLSGQLLDGTPRRMQTAPSEAEATGFRLLLTLVLDSSPNTSQTASEITAGLAGSSGRAGFAHALSDELQSQGLPVPGDLSASVPSEAVLIQGLLMPSVEWIVGEWGQCGAQCGEGSQQRTVLCAMGSEVACSAAGSGAGPRPEEDQACEAYDDCAFNLLCPLGPGSMPCTAQTATLLAVILIIACCFSVCAGLFLRRKCRAPKQGKVKLHIDELKGLDAEFRIVRPSSRRSTKASSATLLSRTSSDAEAVDDGKTHIIWDLDMPKVEAYLESTRQPPSGSHPEGAEETEENVVDDEVVGELRDCIRNLSSHGMVRTPGEGLWGPQGRPSAWRQRQPLRRTPEQLAPSAITAYEEGDCVEYWSKTHRKWILGEIRLAFPSSTSGLVRYDVSVGSAGQQRSDVGLGAVRRPLQQDERVEVFSKRGGGRWVPAAVSGTQSQFATRAGYNVLLDGAPEPLTAVPASRLRRLYRPDELVQVYRGPAQGWQPATVQRLALAPGARPSSQGSAMADAPCALGPEDAPVQSSPSLLQRLLASVRRALPRGGLEALATSGPSGAEPPRPPPGALGPPARRQEQDCEEGSEAGSEEGSEAGSEGRGSEAAARPRGETARPRGEAPPGMEPWAWLLALPAASPAPEAQAVGATGSGAEPPQPEWLPTFLVRR